MSNSYYLIHVPGMYTSYQNNSSYHIVSSREQIKRFTDLHGYHNGIIPIKVYGPLKIDDIQEFTFHKGEFIHNHLLKTPPPSPPSSPK